MPKYTYENLKAQLTMLAVNGQTSIEKLRVFYPKVGWTELRNALATLSENDNTVKYNPNTHIITVEVE